MSVGARNRANTIIAVSTCLVACSSFEDLQRRPPNAADGSEWTDGGDGSSMPEASPSDGGEDADATPHDGPTDAPSADADPPKPEAPAAMYRVFSEGTCATSLDHKAKTERGEAQLYITDCSSEPDKRIYRYDAALRDWTEQPGAAVEVSLSNDGVPWIRNAAGNIFRWHGEGWEELPGCATSIDVGWGDDAWIVDCSAFVGAGRRVMRWNGERWALVGGSVETISFADDLAGHEVVPWARNAFSGFFQRMPDRWDEKDGCAKAIGGGFSFGCKTQNLWSFSEELQELVFVANLDEYFIVDISSDGEVLLNHDGTILKRVRGADGD